MATEPATTGARTRATPLSDFARVCAECCPNPDTLEDIARIFMSAAAELRQMERH